MTKLKELSPEQRQELFESLKACFEKNMNHYKGLELAKVQAKPEANTENCGHSMKWIGEEQKREESSGGKAAATAS